ncbi:MAG: hypothetical protein J6331_09270, partial [Lentisphaeria bacterium]|nr:hypothetical protein [Lentisphaeria bacterium]
AVRETRGFGDWNSAGISLFETLKEKGCKLPFIPSEELCKYMTHLNHATMILNPGSGDCRTDKPSMRRKLLRRIHDLHAEEILQDESLDA